MHLPQRVKSHNRTSVEPVFGLPDTPLLLVKTERTCLLRCYKTIQFSAAVSLKNYITLYAVYGFLQMDFREIRTIRGVTHTGL